MTKYSRLLSQIIDYLKDKLPNSERHTLEQDINADPFLSDAIDGFSRLPADELENDLLALTRRLENRTKPQSNKRLYFYLSAAASIVILIGIGVLYFNFSDNNKQIAQQHKTQHIQNEKRSQPDTNQIKIVQEKSQKIKQDSATPSAAAPKSATPLVKRNSNKKTAIGQKKKTSKPVNKKTSVPKTNPIQLTAKHNTLLADQIHKIKGKVKSESDSQPLPGVNIIIKGSTAGTVSDFDGEYELDVKSGDTVVYSFIGYESQEEIVSETTEIADVTLSNQNIALEEVVVVGFGTQKSQILTSASTVEADNLSKTKTNPLVGRARKEINGDRIKKNKLSKKKDQENYSPKGGFRKFSKYIKKNKRIDHNNALEIQAELTIASTGQVNLVNIISSCSNEVQEEVIRLLKEGPTWKRNSKEDNTGNNKVTVIIKL